MKIPFPSGQFAIVYTDPPWPERRGGKLKVRPNSSGVALDYPTMSLDEIRQYHAEFLSSHTLPEHDVFMWTTDRFLDSAESMMQGLGYTLHARIIWDKRRGVAPAFTIRFAHEYLLWFYKRGHMLKPARNMRGKYTDVLRETNSVHSRKPQCAYVMLEDLFPGASKVELFARKRRQGWVSWGDEVEGFAV